MKIKYSPCKWNPYAASQFDISTKCDTDIIITGDNSLIIDGNEYDFDESTVEWPQKDYMKPDSPPGLMDLTNGRILEAHRIDGDLHLTVRIFYTGGMPPNCDAQYHEVQPCS